MTNKKVLILLCMCPPDKSTSVEKKIICTAFALMLFILNVMVMEVHFSYFLKYFSINLAESLYALMYAIAFFGVSYGMISIFFVRKQFGGIFKKLAAIYSASKY